MSSRLILTGLAALGLLTGCGDSLDLKPVAKPGVRVQGKGFSALPPPGADWYVADGGDGVQYVKLGGGRSQDTEDAPHTFFVGASPLEPGEAAKAGDPAFAKAAETLLTGYFSKARRELRSLSVSPYPAKHGVCVQYDAIQVQTRSVQNPTRQPLEFNNHGFVCRYSPGSATWVHGFYSQRYFVNLPTDPGKAALQEAEAFLKGIELTGP